MATPAWILKLVKALYPQRFHLARLTRLPLVGKIADRLFFSGDQVIYLPAQEHIPIHTPIEMESIVLPGDVVEHFIRQADDFFLMHSCLCRSSNDCQDYPLDIGCLFLGKAVHKINPKFGRLVSREEALAHVERARAAGLVHTMGRSRVDSVLLGAGPPRQLLTLCHCCPCCCMWNVLLNFHDAIADTIRRMPGLTVQINENCTGCGACTRDVCFVHAIQLVDGRASISEACRGCGRCLTVCPQNAIEIHVQDNRFVEETIQRIASLVDLT